MLHSAVRVGVLAFFIFGFMDLPSAQATERIYKRECNGCHSAPPKCNGCHAHGTHQVTGDGSGLNLVATTDKSEYVAGEDITVTFAGGNPNLTDPDVVGVKLYDDKGVELKYVKTELPVRLTTRAYAGATTLYVSWVGYDYDSVGGMYGAPVEATFGAGMRLSFLAGVHENERHSE